MSTSAQLIAALGSVQPGQTIRLATGEYHGAFVTQRAGTASAPITLAGPTNAVLVNDGPSGTAPSCPAPGGGWDSGYGLWLSGAPYWNLTGFTVKDSKKGIVVDNSHHVTIDGAYVHHTDDEAVHFRRSSADGVIKSSRITHAGLVQPGFGEAVYIGSANSNWGCHGNSGGVDRSDRVKVLNNTLGPQVAAEHIDVKEGTFNGLIQGNTFNGTGISGQNSADSWVDVKGVNYVIDGKHSDIRLARHVRQRLRDAQPLDQPVVRQRLRQRLAEQPLRPGRRRAVRHQDHVHVQVLGRPERRLRLQHRHQRATGPDQHRGHPVEELAAG